MGRERGLYTVGITLEGRGRNFCRLIIKLHHLEFWLAADMCMAGPAESEYPGKGSPKETARQGSVTP